VAKVLNPLNSTEARGRVGGLVYNTWRGIHTVKTQTAPGHEDDPKRQAHKAIVQAAGIRWRTISDQQRADWNAFANAHPDIDWTGSPRRIAGYHWYVRIQTRLQDIGVDYVDDPPTTPANGILIDASAIQYGLHVRLEWLDIHPLPLEDWFVDLWSTAPLSAGRNPSIHDATRKAIDTGDSGTSQFNTSGPGIYTLFFRLIRINGLVAPWNSLRVEVV